MAKTLWWKEDIWRYEIMGFFALCAAVLFETPRMNTTRVVNTSTVSSSAANARCQFKCQCNQDMPVPIPVQLQQTNASASASGILPEECRPAASSVGNLSRVYHASVHGFWSIGGTLHAVFDDIQGVTAQFHTCFMYARQLQGGERQAWQVCIAYGKDNKANTLAMTCTDNIRCISGNRIHCEGRWGADQE